MPLVLPKSEDLETSDYSRFEYLSTLSPQDKPWDTHRRNAQLVEALYRQSGFPRYADRMQECSEWLLFVLRTHEDDVLRFKLHSGRFCRVRHCPMCQWRKSMKWRGRFLKAAPRLLTDHPTMRFIFLTLTVKNCEVTELRNTLKKMNSAWKKLVERSAFPALGFIKSVEVTRGAIRDKNGRVVEWLDEAHPHFHCLLAVPSSYFSHGYIKHEKWREIWQSCLGVDYLPVVNVKAVKPRPGVDDSYGGLIVALCETLKYSVKEEELISDSHWLEQLTTQLHKTRSVAVGGLFRDYISDDEPEDLIHDDDLDVSVSVDEYGTFVFDWSEAVKKYIRRNDG